MNKSFAGSTLRRIILLGANGSGKTTLGRELARVLDFAHIDVEEYYFYPAEIPYTAMRPAEERNAMLLADMKKHGSFVMSGDISGWGEEFITGFDLVIFLTAPTDIRLKRIENREYKHWGDRVRVGGDMYEQSQKFREFAASRDITQLERKALLYSCPILQVDSTKTLKENIDEILTYMKYNIIHIVGASGAGTSTLGQALEREYGCKWLDTDDYFWQPTDPPFTQSLPCEERVTLLTADLQKYPKCVISGSLVGWGDVFIPQFDLVIFVDTSTDIRIDRLQKRDYERFGNRIREEGDMYEEHTKFIAWAKTYDNNIPPERCRKLHEEWFAKLSCPLLRVDGTKPVDELLKQINFI